MESLVEKVSTSIACEGAARPISSVSGRRKTDDEQRGFRIAESWNRSTPVVPFKELLPLLSCNFFSVFDEAWTASALDDTASNLGKLLGRRQDVNLLLAGLLELPSIRILLNS